MDVWNCKMTAELDLELLKEHWLQMVLRWFLRTESIQSIQYHRKCRKIVNKTRVDKGKYLFN